MLQGYHTVLCAVLMPWSAQWILPRIGVVFLFLHAVGKDSSCFRATLRINTLRKQRTVQRAESALLYRIPYPPKKIGVRIFKIRANLTNRCQSKIKALFVLSEAVERISPYPQLFCFMALTTSIFSVFLYFLRNAPNQKKFIYDLLKT